MTDTWYEAVLDPPSLIRERSDGHGLQHALALLVDARFGEYQRRAETSQWPALGTWPGDEAPSEQRLVAGLGLQLSGSGLPYEKLRAVVTDEETSPPVRTIAAVLMSMIARDASRPEAAVEVLESFPPADEVARLWIKLHHSIALREAGTPALAFALIEEDATEAIRGDLDATAPLLAALRSVSVANAFSFAFAAGHHDVLPSFQRMPPSSVLDRIEARASAALSSLVDQEFGARLQDPSRQTLSFREEDPIEVPLMGALLRSEFSAGWDMIRRARGRLGRYRLLASVGMQDRQPVPAFHLLRRAEDVEGLERAIRWFRYEGPLMPLREYGTSVATSEWGPATLRADLVSIRETADLLTPAVAEPALRRMLVRLSEFLAGLPTARLESVVNGAVAGLLAVAGSEPHQETAAAYRSLVMEATDPLLLQSVDPVIRAIDWESVDLDVRADWQAFALQNIGRPVDARFAAIAAITSLPRTDELRRGVIGAFRASPDLFTGAAVLQVGDAPLTVVRHVAKMARHQLRAEREAAARGQHSFGSYVDVPRLLAHLLVDYPALPGWRDLLAFMSDSGVAGSKKVGPLDIITIRRSDVPEWVARRLRKWLVKPAHLTELPLEDPSRMRGAILRAKLAFGGLSPEDALTEVVSLSTSPERGERLEAARSLVHAATQIGATTTLTVALALSRDRAFEVRATAGASLARLAGDSERPLYEAAWRRVLELLDDPGAMVPTAVMAGLAEAERTIWPAGVRAAIAKLATQHIARRVREAASALGSESRR